MKTITGDNIELENHIRRMFGYGLTGLTVEHALFFLYCAGQSGKSVLTNTAAGNIRGLPSNGAARHVHR